MAFGAIMKKIAIAGVAALIGTPALAADMAVTAPPPPPPVPVITWNGCYVGANIGAGWSRNQTLDAGNPTSIGVDVGTNTGTGVVGGVQVGCDSQFGNWVLGGRGMFDWTDLSASNPVTSVALATGNFTPHEVLGHKTQWFVAPTVRVGYAVIPQLLLYVDGGAALVRQHYSDIDPVVGFAGFATDTRTGWTVGGGAEYLLLPNLSVFAEYDYFGLGTSRERLFYSFAPGAFTFPYNFKSNVQTVLFGVNYRFNIGGASK
jgi:outer membrane immunogenic protein